jgi:hypothetical protein
MWQAWNTKSAIGCIIGNEKMANIMKDVVIYRHTDISTDHFLLSTTLSFPPQDGKINRT